MSDLEAVARYLASLEAREASAKNRPPEGGPDWIPEPRPFITISRQAGAGGHALARALLAELAGRTEPCFKDWLVLDQEICELVAGDRRLSLAFDSLVRERYHGELEDFLFQTIAGSAPQEKVARAVFRTVRGLAAMGRCVILGRAGASLTRHLPLGVHLRLVAPRADRAAALERLLGLDRKAAERRMDELDASRAKLVRTYLRQDIDDPLLYDSVWNTSRVPIPDIAAAAIRLVEERRERYLASRPPASQKAPAA